MKTLPSNPPRGGAGVHTPASPLRRHCPLCWKIAFLTALTAVSWFAGDAIGKLLGRHQLSSIHAGLPTLESLSQEIAVTLHKQGVCLDAPPFSSASQRDSEARMTLLRDQFIVAAPCIDLAIAQNQFETLQIETATLDLIQRKRSLKTGFVVDSLNYRSRLRRRRSEVRKP